MKKVCLLGGSNSLLEAGLRKGLYQEGDLNLALGATTSLQNIYSLASNDVSEYDVIVSESNVNDIQAVTSAGYSINLIKENISNLYREIYRLNKVAIIIIVPAQNYEEKPAPQKLIQEIIDDINNHHRTLAEKYGFYLVDIASHFRNHSINVLDAKKIQPDWLHPIDGFMCLLGFNLRSFIEGLDTPLASPLFESQYLVIKPDGDYEKSNSFFKRKLKKLNGDDLKIDIGSSILVGIETWSDDQSEIHIQSNKNLIVKQFGDRLSFNEVIGEASGSISLRSNVGESSGTTEKSINIISKTEVRHDVILSGLLLKKPHEANAKRIKSGKKQTKHLDAVIPDVSIFISAIAHFLMINSSSTPSTPPTSVLNDDIDLIRNIAIELEETDLHKSLQLMRVAYKLRPEGPAIKAKVLQYESQLLNS